jgi:radical SAM superfamily enzyme YgiQ (UPF0313 family)
MKILLVNPNYTKIYSKAIEATGINPPIGLAYIASYLRNNDVDVEILDANALQIPDQNLKQHLPKDFDVVGVSSFTPSIDLSINVLKLAREINPECKTIMGGAHITGLPIQTMEKYPIVDVGVLGEGEETTLSLAKAFELNRDLGEIRGIIYRKKDELRINEKRSYIKDLDLLPIPAYDLLPMEKYCLPSHHSSCNRNISTKPFVLLMTSRGCPYNCTFCASKVLWGQSVRFRRPDLVLEEISILREKYGITTVEIADDCFTLNRKRLREMLSGLREDHTISFNCLSRVDTINRDILSDLKDAGCYLVRFGVESGSQTVLDAMKKGITVEQIRNAFKLCKEIDLPANASFILGTPRETEETINETIAFAKEINPSILYIFFAMPLVGTELREEALTEGLILNDNWETWNSLDQPIMRSFELSGEQLASLKKEFYREFYFRPKYILDKIRRVRGWEQVDQYINGFKAVRKLSR